MKQFLFPALAIALLQLNTSAQTPALLKEDGSNYTPCTSVFEDANGLVGIGTTGPAALLHIDKHTSNTTDYFSITQTSLSGFTAVTAPLFTVNTDGNVGIGTAQPNVQVHIKARPNTDPNDPLNNPPAFVITNPDDYPVAGLYSFSNNGYYGGGLYIKGYDEPNTDLVPALLILDETNSRLPFAVAGNGLVAMGHDVSNGFTPLSQVDIRKYNNYDYLLNIGGQNGLSDTYFNISNNGNVGIGIPPHPNTTLTLYRSGADTYFDLLAATNYNKAIRFMGPSNSQPRHVITEANGDFVIDPGISGGGGNDVLVVEGKLETANNVTINGTLTVRGNNNNQFKVGTDGKVRAREIQVDLQPIPDYVFDGNYKLKTIEELSEFINSNRHLPNIRSECEFDAAGSINLGELNLKLLEKVEELSLYIIQLNHRIKTLEDEK